MFDSFPKHFLKSQIVHTFFFWVYRKTGVFRTGCLFS